MDKKQRIHDLLTRYYEDKLTSDEAQELYRALNDSSAKDTFISAIVDLIRQDADRDFTEVIPDSVTHDIEAILATDRPATARRIVSSILRRYKFIASAAAVLLLIGCAVLFWYKPHQTENNLASSEGYIQDDFQPGREGAVLVLSDGTKITLDSLGNSSTTYYVDGMNVLVQNGQVIYVDGQAPPKPVYNTMETAKGRQYQLVLADGTKVWLNAASSITYPVVFSEDSREVSISGEAYFEVSPMKDTPFIVHIKDDLTQVKVLGTSFNVNAYKDGGHIQTTLLEGIVKVAYNGNIETLNPGQQALTSENQRAIFVHRPEDLTHIIAWRNNLFSFDNAPLKTVMKELGRWYDFETEYAQPAPSYTFSGKIDKSLTLQQVLSLLGATHIKYRITGDQKITIYNENN